MNEGSVRSTNNFRCWWKLLAWPLWVKAPPAIIMRLAFLGALGLRATSMVNDVMGSTEAVSVTTVALPMGVIVVALVFANGGAPKHRPHSFQRLTQDLALSLSGGLSRFVRNTFKAETHNV